MRGRSFASILNAMARESARRGRVAEAEHRRQLRAYLQTQRDEERQRTQAQRDEERQRALDAKGAKQQHIEECVAEAQDKTIEVQDRINELRQILQHTFSVDDTISFDSLRIEEIFLPFSPKPEPANPLPPPSKQEFLKDIKPPSGLLKLIPGSQDKYRTALRQAEGKYRLAFQAHKEQEAKRLRNLEEAKQKYEESKREHEAQAQRRNEEVDEFEACYKQGDPKAVVGYNTMVLERSYYPEGFPHEFRTLLTNLNKPSGANAEWPKVKTKYKKAGN